jgi:hypothetical protein
MINSNPFPMGTTPFAGQTLDVSSTYANVPLQKLEGMECVFVDRDPSDLTKTRSSQLIKTRIVRNCAGVVLQGKYAVKYSVKRKRVDGYSRLDGADVAGVVDPYLGSSGVPDGDLFHLVEEGPCIVKTPKTGAAFGLTTWAAGDDLCAVTDTAANATTTTAGNQAGRFQALPATWSATQTTDGTAKNYVLNSIAEVITARTSGETSTDTLVNMKIPR